MDIEDLEGSVGSDLDDLINIECDMEDDDIENIDTSLLLSDTEQEIQPENKMEVKESPPSNISEPKSDNKAIDVKEDVKTKVEPKTPEKKADSVKVEAKTPSKVETKPPVTAVAKVETKTHEKTVSKTFVKKEIKTPVKTETKTPVKTETKSPVKTEIKTPSKTEIKPSVKVEEKATAKKDSKPPVKAETKTPLKNGEKPAEKTANKPLVKKSESKPVEKKEDSKKKELKSGVPSGADLVVIDDDDDDEVRSVETIEGDVDDFPEEWMVLDEMDDDPKGKDSGSHNRDDKSRKDHDSSRYRSRRRRSRSRSRSRSRGRGRSDSRRRDRERDHKSRSSSHRTPDRKGPAISKSVEKSKPIEKKDTKLPEKRATAPKTTPIVKEPEPTKPVDPFKNMRDTIEKFDKSWRWNLKISPVDINDLNNETFRQIMAIANDSVLVFNMQNDKKRKYGFLDLCLTSAGEIRQAIDKLSQLRLETNFVHVSVSHKLFEQNAGTESALLKLDLREGRHITATPVKGTEKQRKINISNGPKGMSKIILDAIFAKIVNIVITDNSENETRNATVMCANPESVGGVLRFYQSVVIGGRRLQIRSEVPPPPPLKEAPKEDRKSPAVLSNNDSKSSNQKSRQDDRNKRQNDNRRRGSQNNNNDGLLGPGPGAQDRRRAMEEAERRQESLSRLGITVGVDDFLERPGLLEAPDIVIKETKRLQREFNQNQQIFENNMIQEFRMQEEMRIRDIEMRHQAELADQKRQQEELILRMQQERDQHLQAQKHMELEQQERERLQRLERVNLEKERLEREMIERERLERLKQAKLESDRIERDRLDKKRKEEEERARKEKLAREQLDREQRERERLEEMKRQGELRRQREERDAKLRQEQQQRDRYIRSDLQHGSSNNWQRSLHLQNEQEQFEKEIGLRSDTRKRQSRFDAPEQPAEEKKNLHQKIREQWEKQVAEASRSNPSSGQNNQRDDRRNESNGNNQSGNWGRPDHIPGRPDHIPGRSDLSNKDPYGGTWDMPGKTEGSGYGGNWGAAAKGQGLLGAAPNKPDPVQSAYSSTVREYGHQGGKRNNPWGDQAPPYGEKRTRGAEMGDYQQRDVPSLLGQRPGEEWSAQASREPERNYDQGSAGWGSGAVDPYRSHGQQQQQQQPQYQHQQHPAAQHHQQQHHHHQQQQYHPNW